MEGSSIMPDNADVSMGQPPLKKRRIPVMWPILFSETGDTK